MEDIFSQANTAVGAMLSIVFRYRILSRLFWKVTINLVTNQKTGREGKHHKCGVWTKQSQSITSIMTKH